MGRKFASGTLLIHDGGKHVQTHWLHNVRAERAEGLRIEVRDRIVWVIVLRLGSKNKEW